MIIEIFFYVFTWTISSEEVYVSYSWSTVFFFFYFIYQMMDSWMCEIDKISNCLKEVVNKIIFRMFLGVFSNKSILWLAKVYLVSQRMGSTQ